MYIAWLHTALAQSVPSRQAWVAQQFRNLSVVSDDLPKYLIHDRDDKYPCAC